MLLHPAAEITRYHTLRRLSSRIDIAENPYRRRTTVPTVFNRARRRKAHLQPEASPPLATASSTDLVFASPAMIEALPRIEEALVALVMHARQLDDRLASLEQRLDDHALDLSVMADLATRADIDSARAEFEAARTDTAVMGERLQQMLSTALERSTTPPRSTTPERSTREPQERPAQEPTKEQSPTRRPLFAPVPIPIPRAS